MLFFFGFALLFASFFLLSHLSLKHANKHIIIIYIRLICIVDRCIEHTMNMYMYTKYTIGYKKQCYSGSGPVHVCHRYSRFLEAVGISLSCISLAMVP